MAPIASFMTRYGEPLNDRLPFRQFTHTMPKDALARYVNEKFSNEQRLALLDAMNEGLFVDVVGVYSNDWREYAEHFGLNLRLLAPGKQKMNHHGTDIRPVNGLRPVLYSADNRLVLFVFPCPEYVQQYAELILQLWRNDSESSATMANDRLLVRHFPKAYSHVAEWTGLTEGLGQVIQKDDLVIIGNVDRISDDLRTAHDWPMDRPPERFGIDNLYLAYIHENERFGRAVLLAVKYSFWGSASGHVADAIATAGATELIYAGKMGTLSHTKYIHDVLCPVGEYYLWQHNNNREEGDVKRIDKAPPQVLNDIPLLRKYHSGPHLSVPTVIGETLTQQKSYHKRGITTIDNETSYIAARLAGNRRVAFSAIHFVTDYVANDLTHDTPRDYDLGHAGTPDVNRATSRAFQVISEIIATHGLHRRGIRIAGSKNPSTPSPVATQHEQHQIQFRGTTKNFISKDLGDSENWIRDGISRAVAAFHNIGDHKPDAVEYQEHFRDGAKKACQVLTFVNDVTAQLGGHSLGGLAYVSIGGADGGEAIAALEKEQLICKTIILEYDDDASRRARERLRETGRDDSDDYILVGDAWSNKDKCNRKLREWRSSGAINTVLISAQSVMHELPHRSEQTFTHNEFFSAILDNIPNYLLCCREPCRVQTPGWNGQVHIVWPAVPNDALVLLASFLQKMYRNEFANEFGIQSQINSIANGVTMPAQLAAETIKKILYFRNDRSIPNLTYELGECHAAFNCDGFHGVLQTFFPEGPTCHLNAEIMISDTLGSMWNKSGVVVTNSSGQKLQTPHLFTRFQGWHVRDHTAHRESSQSHGPYAVEMPNKMDEHRCSDQEQYQLQESDDGLSPRQEVASLRSTGTGSTHANVPHDSSPNASELVVTVYVRSSSLPHNRFVRAEAKLDEPAGVLLDHLVQQWKLKPFLTLGESGEGFVFEVMYKLYYAEQELPKEQSLADAGLKGGEILELWTEIPHPQSKEHIVFRDKRGNVIRSLAAIKAIHDFIRSRLEDVGTCELQN